MNKTTFKKLNKSLDDAELMVWIMKDIKVIYSDIRYNRNAPNFYEKLVNMVKAIMGFRDQIKDESTKTIASYTVNKLTDNIYTMTGKQWTELSAS